MRIKMTPHIDRLGESESGISTVVRAYFKHLPEYGIELVGVGDEQYDLHVVHAGVSEERCDIAMLHGLYWTADYRAQRWEYKANSNVFEAIRTALAVTVPSAWVAETIQRDARIDPVVIPHGIDWQEWNTDAENGEYVIAYAKNRIGDVCDPTFIPYLAEYYKDIKFIVTLAQDDVPPNVKAIGVVNHKKMKKIIEHSSIVMSPIKETFGMLTLEAMAAGIPVLGYANGGNLDLVEHGKTGYLARPGDTDDLMQGLSYCLEYRDALGKNGRERVKQYTWDKVCKKLAKLFDNVLQKKNDKRPFHIDKELYQRDTND